MRMFLLIFAFSSVACAGGPKYGHEGQTKLEFENVYHDIENVTNNIYGTRTNNSAPVGTIGEVVSSFQQSVTTTGGAYVDIATVTLTAGDWMITGEYYASTGGSTNITEALIAITSSAGDTGAGIVNGDNTFYDYRDSGINSTMSMVVVPRRHSIAVTTSYYLKANLETGSATANLNGRLTAWRIR